MAGWLTAFHNLRHDDHHLYQLQIAKPTHEWLMNIAQEYGSDREATATAFLEICVEHPSREQLCCLARRLQEVRHNA